MARSDKKIIRVRQILGFDAVVVAEVGEGADGHGKAHEMRNGKIALGGVDSFWLVTGEKKESKLSARVDTLQLPTLATETSTLVGRMGTPDVTRGVLGFGGTGKPDAVSYATATRLAVVYYPRHMTHGELVAHLRGGRLEIPSNGAVDAIEVRSNVWITSGFNRRPNGLYGFSPKVPIRAVPSVTIEGKPDCVHLPSGLTVFSSPPRWSPATETDLRPDEEILRSAEEWLTRAAAAASEADGLRAVDLSRLLEARIAATVDDNEKEDLESALRALSGRASLLELMPQLLSRDPNWKKNLREFERAERERLSEEVRRSLESETQEQDKRLEELRIQVADAETRLAAAAHREVLLRNESEQHEARLQEKIAEVARRLETSSSGQSKALLDEVERLRTEVAGLAEAAAKPAVTAAAPPVMPDEPAGQPPPPVVEAPPAANEEARLRILRELAADSGLSLAEVVAVMLHATEDAPVFLGERGAGLASHFADAIGGSDAAVVYCDPTRISLSDLLQDEFSGFAKAIETAKARPDELIPVAFCGITNGPCEYWLPQLLEMRRLGRVPRNTAFFASAGADGMRVSVPKTVLRYLFPMKIADSIKTPVGTRFAGQWPVGKRSDERFQEALDLLASGKDIAPDFMAAGAKMLSRMPALSGLKMSDVAAVLLRQGDWIEALDTSSENENLRFFQNIGG